MSAAAPLASPARESEWISAARYAIAWVVPAVFCLLVKFLILGNGRGFRVVARFLGRSEGTGNTGLSIAERLTFFRSEVVWLFIVVPLLLILGLRYLNRPFRIILMSLVSVFVSLILFVQARSLEEMGDFVSFAMLRIGLTWGINNPGANKSYLFGAEFYALIAGLAAIAGILWWAARMDGRRRASVTSRYFWREFALTYFSFAALVGIAAWRPLLAATPYHANILTRSIESLWAADTMDTREFEGVIDGGACRTLSRYGYGASYERGLALLRGHARRESDCFCAGNYAGAVFAVR